MHRSRGLEPKPLVDMGTLLDDEPCKAHCSSGILGPRGPESRQKLQSPCLGQDRRVLSPPGLYRQSPTRSVPIPVCVFGTHMAAAPTGGLVSGAASWAW